MTKTHELQGVPDKYSVSDLSRYTNVETERILSSAVALGINIAKENKALYVNRCDVTRLLGEIGKDVRKSYYDLSHCILPHLNTPWAESLLNIYREDAACPASISPSQGEFLRALILNINPKVCLEIGCFIGASTLWICSALEDCSSNGVLHSVDFYGDKLPFGRYTYIFHPDALNYIRMRLEQASLCHRNIQHVGDSRLIGNSYDRIIGGTRLDFLFIDGDHTKEGCSADFLLYEPHLAPGGYLVFHDIFPEKCGWDGPNYIINTFIRTQRDKYQLIELNTTPLDYGMAVIKKLSE